MLDTGNGVHIEISQAPDDRERISPIMHHFSLEFEDAEAAYARALANGAVPHEMVTGWGPPRQVEAGVLKFRVGVVRGPGGEIVEILERRK